MNSLKRKLVKSSREEIIEMREDFYHKMVEAGANWDIEKVKYYQSAIAVINDYFDK